MEFLLPDVVHPLHVLLAIEEPHDLFVFRFMLLASHLEHAGVEIECEQVDGLNAAFHCHSIDLPHLALGHLTQQPVERARY